MKRLCLVVLCCGTICGVEFTDFAGGGIPVYWRSILENMAELRPVPPNKDVSIDIRESNTLHEELLSMGDARINIRSVTFHCALSDEDVEVLCSLPNLRAVSALTRDAVNDVTIMKLTRLPDLRELGFFSQQGTITDTGLQLLSSFKKLETLSLCNGRYTDNGLASLGELERLRELYLSSPVATDKALSFLENLTELRKLRISSSRGVTDAGLSHLRGLNKLEDVEIWWCPTITGEGLSYLSHLRSLKRLSFNSQGITESGIASIVNLQQLSELKIYNSPLEDIGMVSVGQLTNLRKLELLYVNGVTDVGLSQLQNMSTLEDLTIRSDSITGEGLSSFSRSKSLKRLVLAGQGLTVSSISFIKDLQQITELHIGGAVTNEMLWLLEGNKTLESLKISSAVELPGTSGGITVVNMVDDMGIEPLKSLRQLKSLDISSTRITKQGVDALQRAMPDCEIKR